METDAGMTNFFKVCDLCGLDHASQQCPQLAEPERSDAAISLAEMTLPKGFFRTKDEAGVPQVLSLNAIPAMAKMGPFEAKRTLGSLSGDSGFVLRVFRADGGCVTLDTSNENECNWLSLVPTASSETEQNLMAVQLNTDIFYLTTRAVQSGEYLKVWYAPHYAKKLGKPAKPDGGRTSTLLSLTRAARLVTTATRAAGSESVVRGALPAVASLQEPQPAAAYNVATTAFASQAAMAADMKSLVLLNGNAEQDQPVSASAAPRDSAIVLAGVGSDQCTETVNGGGESSVSAPSLRKSTRSVKNEQIEKCKEENIATLDDRGLVKAVKRMWRCKECSSSFSSPRGLGKHKKDTHKPPSLQTQSASLSEIQVPPTPTQSLQARSSVSQLPAELPVESSVETDSRPLVEFCVANDEQDVHQQLGTTSSVSQLRAELPVESSVETDSRPLVEFCVANEEQNVHQQLGTRSSVSQSPAEFPVESSVETDSRPLVEFCVANEEQDVHQQLHSTDGGAAGPSGVCESQGTTSCSTSLSVRLQQFTMGRPLTSADHASLGIKRCSVVIEASARKQAIAKLPLSNAVTRGSNDGVAKARGRAKRRTQPPKRLLDSDSAAVVDAVSDSSSICDRPASCAPEGAGGKRRYDGHRPASLGAPEEAGGEKRDDGHRPASCAPEEAGRQEHGDGHRPVSCAPEEAGRQEHEDGHRPASLGAPEEADWQEHGDGHRPASCASEEADRHERGDGHCEQSQMQAMYCEIIVGNDHSPLAALSQSSATNVPSDAAVATTADHVPSVLRSAVALGAVVPREARPATQCGDCGVIFAKERSLTLHRCSKDRHSNVELRAVTLDGLNVFRKDGGYFCPECSAESSIATIAARRLVDPAACNDAAMKLSVAVAQAAANSAASLFQTTAELQQHLVGHSTHFRCDVCLRHIAVVNAQEHCQKCTGPSDVMGPKAISQAAFDKGSIALGCEHCFVSFDNSEYLNRHKLMHLGAYQCNRCNESFSGRFLLLQHLVKCNRQQLTGLLGQDSLACKDCVIPFITPAALNTHVAVCHLEHYVCRQCEIRFSSKLLFEGHSCTKVITCKLCQQTFNSREAFQQHAVCHKTRFLCTVCSRKFCRRQDFMKHNLQCEGQRMLQEEGTIACSSCSKAFKDIHQYVSHALAHDHPYPCSYCGYLFERKINVVQHEKSCIKSLNKHLATRAAVEPVTEAASTSAHEVQSVVGQAAAQRTNEEASVTPPAVVMSSTAVGEADLTSSVAAVQTDAASTSVINAGDSAAPSRETRKKSSDQGSSSVVELFECIICGRLYSLKSSLNKHLKTHGDKRFQCRVCHKMFYEHHAMRLHHDAVHAGLLCVTCKYCDKLFRTKYTMRNHVKQFHSTEIELHPCDQCGKSFRQKGNLHKHLLMHESQHRYECRPCQLTFRYPEQYRRHEVLHEQGRTLPCSHCERRFVLQHELRKHERDFHCTTVYVCPICLEVCRWRHTIRRHIKRLHPNHGFQLDASNFIDSLKRDTYGMNASADEQDGLQAEAGAPRQGHRRIGAHRHGGRKAGTHSRGGRRAATASRHGGQRASSDASVVPVQVQLGTTVPAGTIVTAESLAGGAAAAAATASRFTTAENFPNGLNGVFGGVAQAADALGNDVVTTASADLPCGGLASTAVRFPPTRSLFGSAAVAAAAAAATAAAAAGTTAAAPAAKGLLPGAARPSWSTAAAAPTGLATVVASEAAVEKRQFSAASTARVVTEGRPLWSTAPAAGYVSAADRCGGSAAARQCEGQLPEGATGDGNASEPLLPFGDLIAYISPMETSEPGEEEASSVPDVSAPEALRGATINIFMEEGVTLTPESAEALQNAITHNLPSLVNSPNPIVFTIGNQQITITVTADGQTPPDTATLQPSDHSAAVTALTHLSVGYPSESKPDVQAN